MWHAAVVASLTLAACGGDKHRLIVLHQDDPTARVDAGAGEDGDAAARGDAAAEPADGGRPGTPSDAAATDGAIATGDGSARTDSAVPPAPDAGVCRERAPTGVPLPEHVPAGGCAVMSAPAFNVALGGVATSDTAPVAGGSVGALFDDNTGTDWVATATDEPWAGVDLGADAAHTVATYRLTSSGVADRAEDPSSWSIQGSDDARCDESATWVTLDTRAGEVFGGAYDTRTFALTAPASFRQYRLVVTGSQGAPAVRIAELELFGPGTPVTSVDDAHRGPGPNAFTFGVAWNGQTFDPHSARYSGSTSWTSHVGAELTVSFVGSQILLYGVKDPAHGILQVWLDDTVAGEADLYGPVTAYNQLVYASPTVCPGDHVLRVRVTGKKNPASRDAYGSLDRVVIVP